MLPHRHVYDYKRPPGTLPRCRVCRREKDSHRKHPTTPPCSECGTPVEPDRAKGRKRAYFCTHCLYAIMRARYRMRYWCKPT